MNHSKYHRLRTECQASIADNNLEKCFELMRRGFNLSKETEKELILLERKINQTNRERRNDLISKSEADLATSQVANGLVEILDELKEDDISSNDAINDVILVIACKHTPSDWRKLFNEAYFSHVGFIEYQQEVPQEFLNADIIVFDDLGCPVKNHIHMGRYIKEMPEAHILYVGKENPLEDRDPEAYERCANANSLITVPARLRELLEFRKVYGQ